ncbi:prepilin peptidase [Streptococcus ruminantium]|uniref:Prepilin peptidase n=1 Tax=Streptococcus ruminantium TaxID=1917441 RepID=A0ABU1B0X4_9STRE|nr:prepilin peptidase [Streptococcus ruminantium]MDQ8759160.1 prepilin peptidase [Streptococcus ruminantium]MDQ8768691.1 prepilin peptidase [Streptococcus ruminantium]MDQ8774459.1 prepilin peptidase [Streptococcus ruminantium]MDQ8793840.1 prepilin peptidase [Streptococcus ruminantium]MDQ8795679.1 prepilin peptidase [Streptococcus ruminantium]
MKTIILFFLGASIGSFLGLVIDRFPEQSIIAPSSHCNACKRRLKAWDLIPVLSQLSTKSKCRYCKAKIPYWYLGLEFLAGLVVLLCHFQVLNLTETILILAGLVLTIYDIKHQEYPFAIWLFFTFVGLVLSQLNWLFCGFLLLAYLTEKWQWKIGSGDFLYLASLSLVFGFMEILWIVQVSSLLGLAIFFIFKPKSLPYVPFLFLASIIINLYL